jgi:hypothetical protein
MITSSNKPSSKIPNNSFYSLLQQNDELLNMFSKMLRDYSEYQLSRLYDTSACFLYSSVAILLAIYQKRLSIYQSFSFFSGGAVGRGGGNGGSEGRGSSFFPSPIHRQSNQEMSYEENIDFINDSLYLLLEILNHLSTKEFLFSGEESSNHALSAFSPAKPSSSSSNSSFFSVSPSNMGGGLGAAGTEVHDIPSVLIYGLQMMIPLIHVSIIYSYPETIEKYLSFVVFLCNSSMKNLVIWWNYTLTNHDLSLSYFNLFMKQLLFSMTVIDSTTAKMAFQVNVFLCLLFLLLSLFVLLLYLAALVILSSVDCFLYFSVFLSTGFTIDSNE